MEHIELIGMLLFMAGLFIGLPLLAAFMLYKMACSWSSEAQAEKEEAEAERLQAENDNLRLQMLRERKARLRQRATPSAGAERLPPPEIPANPFAIRKEERDGS